jgi:glucose-1-phosphate thymidylyltransferase
MKGVILAGGKATRLYPLTLVTNKHLLPVYDKPVIYYAIENLVSFGVTKIMIVTSPHHLDNFVGLLGSGKNFGVEIVYGIQDEPGGLAQGLKIAEEYVGADSCVLHLGDNIFAEDVSSHIKKFKGGALIFLKDVKDPTQFGVAEIDAKGQVKSIDEKPAKPKSNFAVTGLYVYDNSVFKRMIGQKKSARGEYEIGDINNSYITDKKLTSVILKKEWFDVGTIDKLSEASNYMRDRAAKKAKI